MVKETEIFLLHVENFQYIRFVYVIKTILQV